LRAEAVGVNRDLFTFMKGQHYSGHGFVQSKLPSRLSYESKYPSRLTPIQAAATAKRYILERLVDGRFTPVVARMFSLDETVDAFRHIESNRQIGGLNIIT
jgi:hypothetical protein